MVAAGLDIKMLHFHQNAAAADIPFHASQASSADSVWQHTLQFTFHIRCLAGPQEGAILSVCSKIQESTAEGTHGRMWLVLCRNWGMVRCSDGCVVMPAVLTDKTVCST